MITFILAKTVYDLPLESWLSPSKLSNIYYPEHKVHADRQIRYLIDLLEHKSDYNIITQSDVMINAMGLLVESKAYPRDQVKIVIYENQKIERECTYDSGGVLENWRFGWFNYDSDIIDEYIKKKINQV